ncbi:MAG TPA: serine protease, partial [Polyangiaceae bacterium]|nr:serine protease [Polyangiaceae bacterium]
MAFWSWGCSDTEGQGERLESMGHERTEIVYDSDDRREYFDVAPAIQDRIRSSVVVLMLDTWVDARTGTLASNVPTWAERDGICEGERFQDQPAAAFCTGVLVEQDLVLTAGHCLRRYALRDFSVLFEFYYTSAGALAFGPQSALKAVEIVSEALAPEGTEPRLDYAFLRLERAAPAIYTPVPVHRRAPDLTSGDTFLTIGAPHGMPLKIDPAATVAEANGGEAYFVARSDSSAGWSGGGAFDADLSLFGVLSRGAVDLISTEDGCQAEARVADHVAEEAFTYTSAALAGLCRDEPSRRLCDPECEEPCLVSEPALPSSMPESSCALSGPRSSASPIPVLLLLVACMRTARRRAPACLGARPRAKVPSCAEHFVKLNR